MAKKTVAMLNSEITDFLHSHLPKIQKLFRDKVEPSLLKVAQNDAVVTNVSKLVYTTLPAPIRLVVTEEMFIQFCLTYQDKIFGHA
jgi:hypothetical protein